MRQQPLIRWLSATGITAFGGAALVVLAAISIQTFWTTKVQLVAKKDPETIKLDKAMWEPGDSVVELYGTPLGTPLEIAFLDTQNVIKPEEDSKLVLLSVDKERGDNPLQLKTVWFFAWRLSAALAIAAAFCLVAAYQLKRRKKKHGQ